MIGLSGCLAGEINSAIQANNIEKAKQSAAEYRDILGAENFFIELHDHGMEEQRKCMTALPQIARDIRRRIGRGQRCSFSAPERSSGARCHALHRHRQNGAGRKADALRAGAVFQIPGRNARACSAIFPKRLRTRWQIGERCHSRSRIRALQISGVSGARRAKRAKNICAIFVTAVCSERYGERAASDPELIRRLDYELGVLEKTGFVSYLLIVWDFIHFAKERGIPVGPGRGSAAGSMVAYVLGITDIDPLQFGLLFERFLNPDRVSPPDIDVDFCEARRGEVLEYVRQKYGERRVAQIITFGKLKAKSVVRDVGPRHGAELSRCRSDRER